MVYDYALGRKDGSLSGTANSSAGFSLIELLVVVMIILILSAISIPYIYSYKSAYKSEDQALKVMDLIRETSQLALSRRRTFRLEIDLTDNAVLVIDEDNGNPDTLLKSIPLEQVSEVRMDVIPTGITRPDPPKYNDAPYVTDVLGHRVGAATVNGHKVWAARFRSDGSVVNAANTPTSTNLYIWPPKTPGSTTPRRKEEVRVITMFGGSGAIRYWQHNGTTFVPFN